MGNVKSAYDLAHSELQNLAIMMYGSNQPSDAIDRAFAMAEVIFERSDYDPRETGEIPSDFWESCVKTVDFQFGD